MTAVVRPVHGCEIGELEADVEAHKRWKGIDGPPVPITVAREVWDSLIEVASDTDADSHPRVFRLFMPRGRPRQVVKAMEIESVWRNERGILRWEEGGYPPLSEPLRKGGNAFVRGDVDLTTDDAWWMGREQTDLRILFAREAGAILVSAWWARAGTNGLSSHHETDGEVLPVRLLLG